MPLLTDVSLLRFPGSSRWLHQFVTSTDRGRIPGHLDRLVQQG